MNHRFTVDGPVSDLVVVLKPGVRVLGQVTVEGANTEPFDLIRLQVAALTWEDDDLLLVTPDTRVRPGGSFVLDEVVGRATLRVSRVPVGWTVTAVSRGGVDITDVPTDFSTPVGQPVHIVVTDRVTKVEGDVVDSRGQPVSEYTVVVFPFSTCRVIETPVSISPWRCTRSGFSRHEVPGVNNGRIG